MIQIRSSYAALIGAVIVLFATALLPQPAASADFVQQGPKLVGAGPSGTSHQGDSVAISADGNTAIVGGRGDAGNTGAAWVFTRSNGVWTQQGGKLVGSGAVGFARQGGSVALSADGNTAIIGGETDNALIGAAWVFTRSNGVWTQQGGKLVGSGAVGLAHQGWSVALSADGNTAIVGGYADNGLVGAAWVFTRSGGAWTQQGSKLVGSGAVGPSQQGNSVSLSADGNTAIIGGPFDNNWAGAAWVFTRNSGTWSQYGNKLVGTFAAGLARQGFSVALSADGGTAIIGGYADNNFAGAAWVFTPVNGVWTQQFKLVGSGAVGTANQGWSVSLSADGDIAIIGGSTDNNSIGAAWVFTRRNGVWTQHGSKLVGSGAVGMAHQGYSVALSADGSTAIIGGEEDNGFIGAAWVWLRPAAHDLNADGKSDIVWRHSDGTVAVWLMKGAQVSQTGSFGVVPTTWSIVGQRDFNGDLKADLLWRDSTSGATAIWFLNGTSVTSTASIGTIPTTWQVVGTGDTNGDGKGDILWRDTSTGAVAIWLMNGASVTSAAVLGTVPTTWSVVGLADFNGVAMADILWRETAGGATAIWFLNGTSVSSTASIGTIPTTWQIVATGDFNSNRRADLLWRDNTGATAVWLMNGAVVESTGSLGTIPAPWTIAQTGDFNGDGKSDILWRNTTTGETAIWFMNGLQVASTANLGTIPTTWTIQSVNAD